jgi:hypothetical protein
LVILRAFLALLAGFGTIALSLMILTALIARIAPEWAGNEGNPRLSYTWVNLGYAFLCAAAGGYITAWASAANPLIHVLVLGIVVLAMSALSALQSRGKQPIWYALCLVGLMPFGVLAGGLLRLRVLGIL